MGITPWKPPPPPPMEDQQFSWKSVRREAERELEARIEREAERPTDLAGWAALVFTWWLRWMPWRVRERAEIRRAQVELREMIIEEVLDRQRATYGCEPWCMAPGPHQRCWRQERPDSCEPWCNYGRPHGGRCMPRATKPPPPPTPSARHVPDFTSPICVFCDNRIKPPKARCRTVEEYASCSRYRSPPPPPPIHSDPGPTPSLDPAGLASAAVDAAAPLGRSGRQKGLF